MLPASDRVFFVRRLHKSPLSIGLSIVSTFPGTSRSRVMLDLDDIFDPDRTPASPGRTMPATTSLGPVLRVEDLPGDWRLEWEERAAILEYDGRLPKERAEAVALTEILG